jgi:hypothetical protein
MPSYEQSLPDVAQIRSPALSKQLFQRLPRRFERVAAKPRDLIH